MELCTSTTRATRRFTLLIEHSGQSTRAGPSNTDPDPGSLLSSPLFSPAWASLGVTAVPAPHLSDGRFLLTHPACAQEATCVGGTRQELGAGKSEEATCVGLSVDEQSLTFLLP